MTDSTTADEEAVSDGTEEGLGSSPFMHVDYRVFEISVHGGGEDSVEDVNEVMEDRLDSALEQIESLKRTDFELDDEFDVDRSGGSANLMTQ